MFKDYEERRTAGRHDKHNEAVFTGHARLGPANRRLDAIALIKTGQTSPNVKGM
jgi:hypothetical protein